MARFVSECKLAIDSFAPLAVDEEKKVEIRSHFKLIESAGSLLSADLHSEEFTETIQELLNQAKESVADSMALAHFIETVIGLRRDKG